MLILLLTGLPVSLILIVVAFVPVMLIKGPAALTPMASATFTSITRDVFLALPQFIFMAAVLEMSGLGSAMYDLMHKWMAGLRGGLAMGTIGISTAMAAMSGSASTATLTMGMLAYPEMEKRGYDKRMTIGCIPAGGVLGPLIPRWGLGTAYSPQCSDDYRSVGQCHFYWQVVHGWVYSWAGNVFWLYGLYWYQVLR